MSLRNKLTVKKNLAKAIEEEAKSGGGDDRLLNYFDLKFNEKMTVLFVPDTNGSVWTKYRRHGTPKGVTGLDSVGCSGSGCPICQVGFDAYEVFKDTNDEKDKEYAKTFWGKDITLASVIVIESPCDINKSKDGNDVKLFALPFAVEKILKEAIVEGQIEEESICITPFVIKKTKNQGGKAAYDSSYFSYREVLDDDELDQLEEELTIELYDYTDLDFIPDVLEDDEAEEWAQTLKNKIADLEKKKASGDGNEKESVRNRLKNRKKSDDGDSDDAEERSSRDVPQEEESSETEVPEKEKTESKGSSLRERLRATSRS